YRPLEVAGKFKEHIVAFARRQGETTAIAIAPRFLTSLIEPGAFPLGESVWEDTHIKLPQEMPTSWTNAISLQTFSEEGIVSIGKALQHFPVALLTS
ncbi:MAG TPA: hypothetical protein V6D26_22805, partial [Stenomitos sp.]